MIDFFILNKILLILITAIGVWLGLLVYLNNRKARVNQLFVLMVFSALSWIIPCYFAVKSVDNLELSLFFARLAYGLAVLFMIPFYFFAIIFIREKNDPLYLRILVPIGSILISFLSVLTNFMAKNVIPVKIGLVPVLGEGRFVYFGFVLFIALYVLSRLFKNYFKSSEAEKLKLQYFLLGFSIFVVANIIFNIILPSWQGLPQYYQFGNYSAIFLFGFTAYAIVKRQLFEIKIVLTQLLVSIFAILLFVQIFLSGSLFKYIWNSALLAIFLFFGYLLIKSIFREIEDKKREIEDKKRIERLNKRVIAQERRLRREEEKLKEVFEEIAEERKRRIESIFGKDYYMENLKLKSRLVELVEKINTAEGELEKLRREKEKRKSKKR